MGRIQAPTGEIAHVGAGVAAVGPQMASLGAALRGSDGMSDPPQTASALDALGRAWATAANRLDDELTALGQAAGAAAVAYEVTDQSQMQYRGPH